MSDRLDCLFLHPVFRRRGVSYFPIFPIGFFAMADYLTQLGHQCRILNLAVEYDRDPRFSLEDYLRRHRPAVVAIDLHWYAHSYVAIELARTVKRLDPAATVVLGGYTSSFFDREILADYPFINLVVRGEGEIPLAAIVEHHASKNYDEIPNVTARVNGTIRRSETRICTQSAILDTLDCARLELLDHYPDYVADCSHSSTISYINMRNPIANLFYLTIGRGCGNDCSYCGGSHQTYQSLTGRCGPYVRPMTKVLQDIKNLSQHGIKTFYFEYDPLPSMDSYYQELFAGIREAGIDAGANFASWGLPSSALIESFAATFNQDFSCFCFVPKSGAESVRALNKSNDYSNLQLIAAVEELCDHDVFPSIGYKIGSPGESYDTFKETLALFQRLRRLPLVQSICLLPTDPGAPMFTSPEKYRIVLYRRRFKDFYDAYRDYAAGRLPRHPIGYATEFFSERALLRWKAEAYKHFYMRPDYILNRKKKSRNLKKSLTYMKIFFSLLAGMPEVSVLEEK